MSEASIAVVGTGYWGRNLVRNFHAMGVLGAICDTSADALEAMLEAFPGPRGAKRRTSTVVGGAPLR